ncbi:hypothetical protein FWF89_02550 [Candidatus Saccharibacteria bacterium]|nr:hypothetical protein [Candidatus Saccharibacteria bacterium]
MPLTVSEQIRTALSLNRFLSISIILSIMDGLCPTCPENAGFNPDVEYDCTKRAGRISAAQVYDGDCDDETLEHWLGAIQDYVGAAKLLAAHCNDSPPTSKNNHDFFVDGCRRAQALIMEHSDEPDWNGWQYVQDELERVQQNAATTFDLMDKMGTNDSVERAAIRNHQTSVYVLRIGMSYKLGDKNDPVYAEMKRLGLEPL